MKRIGVFVDVQNIYYTTKQAFGRSFNYRQFYKCISNYGDVVIANAYAIESQDDGQRRFQSAIRSIGFEVKLKPFIQRADGSAKGDWDVGITLDVIDAASQLDHIILLSGDGDFSLLLDKVKQDYGLTTQVFGVERLTARALLVSADTFTPIDESALLTPA